MLVMFSALAAIIPMLFYLFLIWKFDRYDKEPIKFVFVNYLWGALGAIILSLIGSLFLTMIIAMVIEDKTELSRFGAIIVAPIVEEITKGLFLLITINSKKFDNITDGIVYGGAIGLGFGMTENFLYFVMYGDTVANWISLVIIRSLFSAVMHCVSTATLGAFLGYAKFNKSQKKIWLGLFGISCAIFIHSMWNLTLSYESMAPIGFVFIFISVLLFIITFSLSLKNERRIIEIELREECESGLIPASHLSILSSSRREKKGWLDESVRKLYIKAATSLAFRKMQTRNSSGVSREYYQLEVDNYRAFVRNLLIQSNSN